VLFRSLRTASCQTRSSNRRIPGIAAIFIAYMASDGKDKRKHPSGAGGGMKAFYDEQLRRMPRFTNFCVSMVISSCADTVAQLSGHKAPGSPPGFDFHRNRALCLTCGVYNGVILTTWLLTLGSLLPGTDMRSILYKLGATQFFLQPFVYVPFFFLFHGMLMGDSVAESVGRLQHEYFGLLIRLWSIFMPTRAMMFILIPLRYQVLWDSCISFGWQLILSLFSAGHLHEQAVFVGVQKSRLITSRSSDLADFTGFGALRHQVFAPRAEPW